MVDVSRILAEQNEGERLLIEISEALNAGDLPSKSAIDQLSEAISAMLSETDPDMRRDRFLHVLGMRNPTGRPVRDSNGPTQAFAYWCYRLQGNSKTKARELAAEEMGCSTDTIKRKTERYPAQGERALQVFQSFRLLAPVEARAGIEEVREYQAKTR